MAPDERRIALVRAALSLVRERGLGVSTRDIARAAGVDEDTVVGVFSDRSALISAVLISAFDPEPVLESLGAIDPAAGLRDRLSAMADILHEWFALNAALLAALRSGADRTGADRTGGLMPPLSQARDQILAALTALLDPDRDALCRSPATAARLLFTMVLASTRGLFGESGGVDSDHLVGLLLDGLLARPVQTVNRIPGRHRAKAEPRRSRSTLIRLLRPQLRPYVRPIVLVIMLQLVQTIATLYLPTLNADIIDHGVIIGNTGYIVRTGGVMLAVTLLQIACAIGAVFFGARAAMALGRDLRAAIFGRVQEFSARELGNFGVPSLITRTTNDVQQVQMLVLLTFTLMVSAPIMCVGGIVMALHQDVPLSALLLIAVPVLIVLVAVIISRMRPLFRTMQERIDKVNRILREQITGIRVIRAFVRDDHERTRFAGASTELMGVALGVGRLMALMFPTVMLVVNVSSVAVLWFGGQRIASGGMQVGALTAFLSYLMQILMAVMTATFMFVMIPRAEVCAERIEEVLETESSVRIAAQPVTTLTRHGYLELRDVEFRYPGAEVPVLRGIDLVAWPGQTTAVIGSTGSGKTTLINLVPRLFDATGGAVLVDGVDVRDLDPRLLSRCVGLVPQKPYLFSGTVASNLRYGKPAATDEELWRALDVAQARPFVEQMTGGLQAPIAQGGSNVSGGQRQRLAIARALVRRPEVYLFDDSFSALDYATDAALRRALAREIANATIVIVAQRVSTIRDADRIVVLDAGQVVGTGTHHELMADNPTYREIVLSQLTEQEAAT